MARIVSPGSSQPNHYGARRSAPFFVVDLVRRYGVRAVFAILFAAVFAFAPLATLYWFAEMRLQPVISSEIGQRVVVKPAQTRDEQEREKPGDTALLQVTCDVPTSDGWHELLRDDDKSRSSSSPFQSSHVRRERVYVRRAGSNMIPFGLLGAPPVSVWLPVGNYEVLVVYDAPSTETRLDVPGRSFPWLSEFTECSLEPKQKTVCRVPLPHYDRGNWESLLGVGADDSPESTDRKPSFDEITRLRTSCETSIAIPTPAGYLMQVEEPLVQHREGHRHCYQDFESSHTVFREWTRSQIYSLRRWLPEDATLAIGRLAKLEDQLGWRQFLEGWFCYVAAGVSGLVFTRWGALNLLEPSHRRTAAREIPGLLVKIFLLSIVAWIVMQYVLETTHLNIRLRRWDR